jgi:hypothetical protein
MNNERNRIKATIRRNNNGNPLSVNGTEVRKMTLKRNLYPPAPTHAGLPEGYKFSINGEAPPFYKGIVNSTIARHAKAALAADAAAAAKSGAVEQEAAAAKAAAHVDDIISRLRVYDASRAAARQAAPAGKLGMRLPPLGNTEGGYKVTRKGRRYGNRKTRRSNR